MRLLREAGGFGHSPPPITLEWDGVDGYASEKAEAQQWFRTSSSGKPMMVKDPRMCLTLTFWRDALPAPDGRVFVLRDPLKVARSLEARDGLPMSLGLALWDRHVRSAALGLRGLPTLVVHYDDMLEDPAAGTAKVVEFLGRLGIEVTPETEKAASASINPGLRHQKGTTDEYAAAADVQRELFEQLIARTGIHEAWEPPSRSSRSAALGRRRHPLAPPVPVQATRAEEDPSHSHLQTGRSDPSRGWPTQPPTSSGLP